jgi:site-specific DNA recombinase
MTHARADRYYCSARREKGTCTANRGIRAGELEDRVLTGLKDILLGNEDLIEAFTEEFKREITRLRNQRGTTKRKLIKELQSVDLGIERCLAFITGGNGSPESVRARLQDLEAHRTGI